MPNCDLDFFQWDKQTRLAVALRAARYEGVDRDLTIAMLALAEGEVNYAMLTHRPFASTGQSNCCAVVVGLEAERMDQTVKMSPKLNSFLAARGWMQLKNGKIAPANGFGNPLKPWKTMAAFEYVVATREASALRLFAVGPYQMNMLYSTPGLPQNGAPTPCGFPVDWDDIWDLYMAGSDLEFERTPGWTDGQTSTQIMYLRVAHLLTKWARYNTPKSVYPDGCRQTPLPDGTEARGVPWLQGHTGSAVVAKKLWDGTLYPGRRAYKLVWQDVRAMAATEYP